VEHSSVLNYCMALEKRSQDSPQRSQGTAPQSASVFSAPSLVDGYRVTYLPVDREAAITGQTASRSVRQSLR